MTTVKMLASVSSTGFSYAARQVVSIDDLLASQWAKAGLAEIVESPTPAASAEPETDPVPSDTKTTAKGSKKK